ncbi:MAG TPA: hypothetical protein VJB57_10650 [Dehalococcoidia bacterium]|nr:hypothetical protein [Dehalococcoidia bacterium]
MLVDNTNGDSACLNCGHVTYRDGIAPLPPGGRVERRPSHGGANLG